MKLKSGVTMIRSNVGGRALYEHQIPLFPDECMDLPTVSVVIPARDEASTIEQTIDAIRAQDYAGLMDIVVAEGASRDGTRQILDRLAKSFEELSVVDNPSGMTAAGLNAAIGFSAAKIVVRCDGHAILPPDYVRQAVRILLETGAANVGGRQHAVGEPGWKGAIAIAMTSPLGVGDSRFHYGGRAGAVDTVFLGVFDRVVLDEVGGFDETLIRNQDYELNHRIRKRGHVVWFDPSLVVEYRPRSSIRHLWNQYFEYGKWKRVMLASNPSALKWRQVAPVALLVGLVGSGVAAFTPLRRFAWLIPGAYFGFVAIGAAVEAVKRRQTSALLLPIVLPTMHLAWGLGFLVGSTRR